MKLCCSPGAKLRKNLMSIHRHGQVAKLQGVYHLKAEITGVFLMLFMFSLFYDDDR